jgi:hypothetical protein
MSGRPERVRAYLELPSEQLTASTPGQFCQGVLGGIMAAKGLTASQVAIKAKIPRSQAYNMVSAGRGKLPSKRDQVRAFVEACDLAPVQVALVLDLWDKLMRQAREQADEASRPATARDSGSMTIVDHNTLAPANVGGIFRFGGRRPEPAVYRAKLFVDLMFLVLEDDARTRRALRLLIPLMGAFVAVVAMLTTWAIMQPGHAPMIAAVLGAIVTFPAAALKSATRVSRVRR